MLPHYNVNFQEAEVDTKPLSVTHFHFSAWPDHGVPADKTCLIQFIQRVRKDFQYYDTPPLVVHCSAGVGRSGTFIVLDSMMERMKVEESLDIYAFIIEMRKKRALMVQTEVSWNSIVISPTTQSFGFIIGCYCPYLGVSVM